MLTRFINNSSDINPDERLMGSGTSQIGANFIDVKRYHPGYISNPSPSGLRENGIGLGGAIYILDSVVKDRFFRKDTILFNRVRIQNNQAFTGAAVYSDNYALALVFKRSLITGNVAHSKIGRSQDVIGGPFVSGTNQASSDLAGAVLYGEIVGPIPFRSYHEASNAIHSNDARFLIRLPDAPNTKGVLAGGYGTGNGGVDTPVEITGAALKLILRLFFQLHSLALQMELYKKHSSYVVMVKHIFALSIELHIQMHSQQSKVHLITMRPTHKVDPDWIITISQS